MANYYSLITKQFGEENFKAYRIVLTGGTYKANPLTYSCHLESSSAESISFRHTWNDGEYESFNLPAKLLTYTNDGLQGYIKNEIGKFFEQREKARIEQEQKARDIRLIQFQALKQEFNR